MKNSEQLLLNISIIFIIISMVLTGLVVVWLRNQNNSLADENKRMVEMIESFSGRLQQISEEDKERYSEYMWDKIDMTFYGRMNLLWWLSNVKEFFDKQRKIDSITWYSMYIPWEIRKNTDGTLDFDHQEILFRKDLPSGKALYILCYLDDDWASSRIFTSIADEIDDWVRDCKEWETWTWALRPAFQKTANKILKSNIKWFW